MPKYSVMVTRYGWVDVDAEDSVSALRLVNHDYQTDWIEWSDDWLATDATEYENSGLIN